MLDALSRLFHRSDAQAELTRTVRTAFQLARQTGSTVAVSLGSTPRRSLHPRVPSQTSLGVPRGVKPPEGMLDPRWVTKPRPLMVSPWHTATEGMWFLTDGRGPLCMHLTAQGDLRFLRYRRAQHDWQEV